jgi:hypothetical protein
VSLGTGVEFDSDALSLTVPFPTAVFGVVADEADFDLTPFWGDDEGKAASLVGDSFSAMILLVFAPFPDLETVDADGFEAELEPAIVGA